jgi:hypothetical protein
LLPVLPKRPVFTVKNRGSQGLLYCFSGLEPMRVKLRLHW